MAATPHAEVQRASPPVVTTPKSSPAETVDDPTSMLSSIAIEPGVHSSTVARRRQRMRNGGFQLRELGIVRAVRAWRSSERIVPQLFRGLRVALRVTREAEVIERLHRRGRIRR